MKKYQLLLKQIDELEVMENTMESRFHDSEESDDFYTKNVMSKSYYEKNLECYHARQKLKKDLEFTCEGIVLAFFDDSGLNYNYDHIDADNLDMLNAWQNLMCEEVK